MNIIKHKYGKRTVSLLLAVILVLCPLQVRAADNKPTIEIGDYIQMGTYGGEPIVWRCVAKDSNGPLMLSDRVLCDYMPYDAKTNKNAETGSHRRNSWRDNFGSNHWRDSNIRSWLNSNAEAGKVKWLCGNPPTEDSVYPKTAAYDQKEGFLRSFRSDELGAIRTVKQRSIVSHPEYTAGYIDAAGVDLPYNTTIDTVADGYDSAHYEYIWDRVFLLDVQQLKTVNDNLNGYHIAKNRSGVAWNYWLRTPITTCNHDMRFVTPQGNILRDAPYKGYYGVRPAFYLNTENYTVSSGTGQSAQDPYVVSAPDAPDDSIGISGAVREDVNGDWNVNTDEYLQLEMSTLYTEDPAYANVTVPVYTIQKPRSDKENMVIVYCAEGYTKSQQKQFVEDVKKLWGEVLQIEPYRSMADRFNVYALCTASVDGYGGTSTFFAATAKGGISTNKGNWRNHVLERIIGPAFIEKIHDAHIPNETHPNENTMDHNYRQYDYVYENINQFVVLANSGEYFGGSHDNKQYGIHYIVASARNAYSAFTQRHELGHGLFHLGDEYNYSTVPVDEWNYTTSLNMTATKDPTKVKWKQLLGFRNTYTCPHLDYYPYTYNSSRDCLMRETFQNDFCDVCKLQGIKVMSQLITNPPALYVAVPEVKKYIGGYRNPTKDPSAFEAANSSAYASYQNDRNSRLLSGGSKNSFDYSSMKGQQVELRTIIQNLSDTQAKTVTLRLWVEHSNGEKAVTTDGEQVFTTQEFDIPVWKEKSKFWTKGALDYEGSDFNSGLVNCSLVYTIPENAILQSGDTIGFEIVDHATGEVLADDDTEQQRYVNVTIQYQLEDGTDVPNTMPTTFTVPVGKKVDWQPPQELHGYVFVHAEGMEETVPSNGMTIRYIYKRSEERPEPPVTKNYTVQYNWGSVFPTGATLPLNSSSYSSVQQAKAAVEHFKDDFIFKIRSAILEAYQRRDELNRIISKLDFGKDKYQFVITKNKGADGKYYKMFMDDSLQIRPSDLDDTMDNQLDMFTMEHENQYGEMMNELINIFIPPENATKDEMDEAKRNMDKYADYRTYLSFDMQQIVHGDKEMTIGLSKMIKKNSGGEGQNPLYVALLASFAQLYKINLSPKMHRSPTLRLVVLDEAFSKMDAEKVASCISLIRGLGFQAIISATNDKIQNYLENVDKTFVYANPNKRHISIQEFEKTEFGELAEEE